MTDMRPRTVMPEGGRRKVQCKRQGYLRRCWTPHRISLRLAARLPRLPLKGGVMEWRRQCLVYLSGALFKGGEWLKEQKTMTGFLPPIQPFEGMLERE